MNRAPTTVLVPPIRSQHGSGVRKRKYKRRRSGKIKGTVVENKKAT